MEKQKEYLDKMVIKLKVLDNRIQKLESLTDEVLNEVESLYKQKIRNLHLKKEAIKEQILKIQESGEST